MNKTYKEIIKQLNDKITNTCDYCYLLQNIVMFTLEERLYIYKKYFVDKNILGYITVKYLICDNENIIISNFRYLIFLDSINKLDKFALNCDIRKSIYYCYLLWKDLKFETEINKDILIKISKCYSLIKNTNYDSKNNYVDINVRYKKFTSSFYELSKNIELNQNEKYEILKQFKNINFYDSKIWNNFKCDLTLYNYINIICECKLKQSNIDDYIEILKKSKYQLVDIINLIYFEKRIKYHYYYYKKLDENKLIINVYDLFKNFYNTYFISTNEYVYNKIIYIFVINGLNIEEFENNVKTTEKIYSVFDYDKIIIDMKNIKINIDRMNKINKLK